MPLSETPATGVTLDHIGIPARDPRASADFLVAILGVAPSVPDGPDGDMFNIRLNGSSLLFCLSPDVPAYHMAFRVGAADFQAVVRRLRERQLRFGNDPEDPENGEVSDPLGGAGRVYFRDPNGHLFEVTAPG